tara:strand:+ start:111 stop:1637 length:1527 start_codon:yes stop_codon:yes gene_type:complete
MSEAEIIEDTESVTDSDQQNTSTLLPFSFARKFGVLLTHQEDEKTGRRAICRAMPDLSVISEVRRVSGKKVFYELVDEREFDDLAAQLYSRDSNETKQMVEDVGEEMDLASLADSLPITEDLLEQDDDAPIVRLINALLSEAIRAGASDIHLETFERELIVRFRIDGVLREIVKPKRELAPLLVSRIKVMARLDIAEKRIPQDGRISLRIGGREVDVRVSTMPANSGERVVLRLLDKQAGRLELTKLGLQDESLQRLRNIVHKPHGIFLVTGPTGSGKTTTLYGSLTELKSDVINILTVEDPIEYGLAGIGQTQVNNKADMTFARGLRAILRQDPDVVMVGEIRDLETAEIAVQASLTGHMVMSTLHTNTAVGAVTRLMDMGVEPFLLSSSLVGVLAQRLVRTLCKDCRESRPATKTELDFLEEKVAIVYESKGCDACANGGFKGRTGIYELLDIDEKIRELIHEKSSEQSILKYARTKAPGIREDGKAKVLSGVTSVSEILRVTLED